MERISKETVNGKAYAAMKQAIMSAQFRPGEVLTLKALSTILGTSDMPVREALKRLIAERAVEALPNVSSRIPTVDVQRLREIVELRVMLEGHATALAAKNISKSELDSVEKEQFAAEAALQRKDTTGYLRHNASFHFKIYRASRMSTIIPLIESLWLQFAPTFSLSFEPFYRSLHLNSGQGSHHANLVKALRAGDPVLARLEIEADILEPTRLEGFWDVLARAGSDEERSTAATQRSAKRR